MRRGVRDHGAARVRDATRLRHRDGPHRRLASGANLDGRCADVCRGCVRYEQGIGTGSRRGLSVKADETPPPARYALVMPEVPYLEPLRVPEIDESEQFDDHWMTWDNTRATVRPGTHDLGP